MKKIYLVNCNIADNEEIFEFKENESIEEIKESLNLMLENLKTTIKDSTSIYANSSLDMIKIEISEKDVEELLNDGKEIILAEDSHDIDYSVFLTIKTLED